MLASQRKAIAIGILIFFLLIGLAVGLYYLISYLIDVEECEAQTSSGELHGLVVTSPEGTEIDQYLGVPYAKPPIGRRRFADPEPIGKFMKDPQEAFEYGDSCVQQLDNTFGDFEGSQMWNPSNIISEDCLTLNIWVPKERVGTLPVLVFIHGGGFFSGSSQLPIYDGKALAAQGNMVVVSLNYRLGVFGFLSTGDGRIKGNFGLKDQQMALRWIKANIGAFGGDPDVITISGQSAGGASVGYHMLSAGSYNLFRRAIMQSGTPNAHWAFRDQSSLRSRSSKFITDVGCNDHDNKVIDCLRTIPTATLLKKQWPEDAAAMEFPWIPTVDGTFLTDDPVDLVKEGRFQSKDSLLTLTANEGSTFLPYWLSGFTLSGNSLQNYTMFLQAVDQLEKDLPPTTRRRIQTAYAPSNVRNFAANRDALDKVVGDRSFTCPVKVLTEKISTTRSRVYLAMLSHQASNDPWPKWLGVKHGDFIQWVFGRPLYEDEDYTEEEVLFSKRVMRYWTNYVRTGDPNGRGLQVWPRYAERSESRRYLDMRGANSFMQVSGLRDRFCQMWAGIDQ